MLSSPEISLFVILSDQDTSTLFGLMFASDLLVVASFGLLHDRGVLLLQLDGLLLQGNQCRVDLLGHLCQVLNHCLDLGYHLGLRLLEQDAIDESPALTVIVKSHDLFKHQPVGKK